MVWKLLSGVTAALLAVSVYFAITNSKALKSEKMLAERAEKDHATLLARKQQGEEAQKKTTAQVETLKKELEVTKQKVTKAAAESQEKDAALQLAKNTLTQVTQQVDTIQKKIDELGNVEKLLADVERLKKEKESKDGEVASETQRLAAKKESLANLQGAITKFRDQEARARKGIVDPEFTASLASVFGEWGFVVLNKGNAGGVFANADLEVHRGKDVIAKLKVRNVEQRIAVADVIPGSVAKGERLRAGDLVKAAPVAAAPTTTAPAPPPAAGAAAAPQTPAAPAPAAAMGGDPFAAGGAMPAGAAPAAPAASDPFGAAPAAPAPAAGGAGTKENPSTADPFGGAPAKPGAGAPPAGGADPFEKK
ncbi:MAG: hypothetical protein K1X78_10010 [Verrucomicrobiaceae bacterium]|nr:hypothetical protein [Verrucomicrobiaceae bacterium]